MGLLTTEKMTGLRQAVNVFQNETALVYLLQSHTAGTGALCTWSLQSPPGFHWPVKLVDGAGMRCLVASGSVIIFCAGTNTECLKMKKKFPPTKNGPGNSFVKTV